MKTLTKTASVFAAIVISALVGVTQQAPPGPRQQSAAVVANNVQFVIEGKVISVHDGDTITVIDQNNKKFHIRLQGIDAPELKQAFGSVSQQNLSRMVIGKWVTIYWTKVDKYRRTVGTIMLDGRDMNIEQVKAGLAWHFKKYEDEQEPQDRRTYAAAEQQARAAKLGLWQDPNSTAPGDWRQGVKVKRWGPPPPEGTIIGNRNSKKYHRPDCSGYRDMAEKNRVFFKNVEEAEAAGYKRAGNCPAEEQVGLKTSPSPSVIQPTSSAAAHQHLFRQELLDLRSLCQPGSRLTQGCFHQMGTRSQTVVRTEELSATRTARFTICQVVQATVRCRKRIRLDSTVWKQRKKLDTNSQAIALQTGAPDSN